jgi:hypothetical protein
MMRHVGTFNPSVHESTDEENAADERMNDDSTDEENAEDERMNDESTDEENAEDEIADDESADDESVDDESFDEPVFPSIRRENRNRVVESEDDLETVGLISVIQTLAQPPAPVTTKRLAPLAPHILLSQPSTSVVHSQAKKAKRFSCTGRFVGVSDSDEE